MTLVYFWPQIVGGRALYWGDIGLYFLPMQSFLRDNLRAGRLPLWNPLILCGTPYVGNPQTWPLYPVTALLPWAPAAQFLNLTVALHVWLAGMGTYLLARRALMLGRASALLAAITFMFGGQLVSKEQFPNMVQAAAWLPWTLWRLDRLLRRRSVPDALRLGAVLGLQLLAAHVQMTVLTLYLAAGYGVFVLGPTFPAALGSSLKGGLGRGREPSVAVPNPPFREDPAPLLAEPPQRVQQGGMSLIPLLLLAGTVAAGLAMGQILPTLALFRDANRQRLPFSVVDRFFLPADQMGNFILPRLHGQPIYGDWTARGNFWETCCYVGWLPFGLAVWGAVAAWRRRGDAPARFWTLVFVLGVWMALGGRGKLYHLAYFVLPGFRSFHDPARCLLPACFALSLLAGYGWERSGLKARGAIFPLALLLAFADLAHFGRTLYPLTDPNRLSPTAPNLAAVRADPDIRDGQARILAPSAGVWLRFTNYKDYEQNTPDYQAKWADTLTPNLTMLDGLRNAYGYEPVALKNSETVAGKADHAFTPSAKPADQAQAAQRAGALGVKYIALCRVRLPQTTLPGLILVRADPTLTPPGRKRRPAAFLYLSRNARWQPRARVEGFAAPVTLQDEGPDEVRLSCATSGPARMVLADTLAAGWRATVDGRAARIEATGGCLRAVRLPGAGPHSVVFSYRPTPFRLGLYLSLLTLAGLAGAAACAGARNIFRREGIGRPAAE